MNAAYKYASRFVTLGDGWHIYQSLEPTPTGFYRLWGWCRAESGWHPVYCPLTASQARQAELRVLTRDMQLRTLTAAEAVDLLPQWDNPNPLRFHADGQWHVLDVPVAFQIKPYNKTEHMLFCFHADTATVADARAHS